VKQALDVAARACGGSPHQATDLFLALRDRRIRLRQFCQYSLSWLRGAANMTPGGRLATAVRLAGRTLSGALVSEKPWAEESLVSPAADDHLMAAYYRAVASYVRRPYAGRVAIVWPTDVPVNTLGGSPLQWSSASDPSLGWRKVAAEVEVHALPGDYTTSITTHVQALANRMKVSVKAARSGQRTDVRGRLIGADPGY
jgi:hypothetical protein